MNMVTNQFVLKWITCMLTSVALCACANTKAGFVGYDEFEKKAFSSMPWKTAKLNLSKKTILEQYQIYLYAVQNIHPPLLRYADLIAERGELAIPFLVEQLKSSTDVNTITDIFFIIKRMADLQIYFADSDSDLWNFLVERSKPHIVKNGQPPTRLVFLVDIQESNPKSNNSKIRLYDQLCALDISSVNRISTCKSRKRGAVEEK